MDLLKKVLALPKVQADIADIRENGAFVGGIAKVTDFEIEECALDNFINGDVDDVLAISEIWNTIQDAIREETRRVTYNVEIFLKEGLDLDIFKIVDGCLTGIHAGLLMALKCKHGKDEKNEKPKETQKTKKK